MLPVGVIEVTPQGLSCWQLVLDCPWCYLQPVGTGPVVDGVVALPVEGVSHWETSSMLLVKVVALELEVALLEVLKKCFVDSQEDKTKRRHKRY